jgi:serine phosphatase RsbU (regulator of sigma subunit)/pSer/pThr/pTyr-binding forkhead associated (FHA) protein
MAILKTITGHALGRIYRVEEPCCRLGRQSDCHISDLFNGLNHVSRHHAQIEQVGDKFVAIDLRSRHGTRINDMLITRPTELKDGDKLAICEVEFRFFEREVGQELPDLVVEADDSSIESTIDASSNADATTVVPVASADLRLQAMVDMLASLGRSLELSDVLDNLLTGLLKIFPQSERAFIGFTQDSDAPVVLASVKCRDPQDREQVRVSRSILSHVMGSKEAVLSTDVEKDSRFQSSESIGAQRIRSVMCAPLLGADDAVAGIVQVDSRKTLHHFGQEDLEVLVAVARLAAAAVEYSRLHKHVLQRQAAECDLAMARRVQTAMLPHRTPEIRGYQFYEFYRAAHTVGGDYYDYIPLAGDRLAVVVADASGKGVAAAMMVATFSGELKYWLGREPSAGGALSRVNQRVIFSECEDHFVTLVLAVLDPLSHEITIANAGHMEPFLRRPDGEVVPVGVDGKGLPLGIQTSENYGESKLKIAPGESITMFSDGFSEAMNWEDQLYGLERMRRVVGTKARDVTQLGQTIVEDVEQFVSGRDQSDDMCLTCFGRV